MEMAMTKKLSKNHYSVDIYVPHDTELPPKLRKTMEDLAREIEKDPRAARAVPLDDDNCGVKVKCADACGVQAPPR
jgi:5,10-methenyltetrahydromethanopterin hydrogenase